MRGATLNRNTPRFGRENGEATQWPAPDRKGLKSESIEIIKRNVERLIFLTFRLMNARELWIRVRFNIN